MVDPKIKPLKTNLLRNTCDPGQFDFTTTDELPDFSEFVGQNRALKAASFGIGINREGFNIFALGPSGIGKRSVMRALLEKEALKKGMPKDICYVHNFLNPREPLVLTLTAGLGKKLADDMQQLIDILRNSLPAIFESPDYTARIKEIQEETRSKQDEALALLEEEAKKNRLTIMRTAQGFVLGSINGQGEIISDKEFEALPEEEKLTRENLIKELHKHLTDYLEKIPDWQKEQREKMKEALKYFTMLQVGAVIDDLKSKYKDNEAITNYLRSVQQAIIDNPTDFRKKSDAMPGMFNFPLDETAFNRYRVNVIVDHKLSKTAPIIFEDNPTFANIVGRIDQVSHFGALYTDFTFIRAGALHKANGGYLLLDAYKLLTQPFAWDGLKRALKAKEIRVENIYQAMGVMGAVSLEPHPVRLDIKIVLMGERQIYYLLCAIDPDFLELFKVAADFDEEINRNPQNNLLFARLITNLSNKDKLKPLTKDAVAAVIDHASRIIGDSQKISTHIRALSDLLREADHYARENLQPSILAKHIEEAVEQQCYRASRIREKYYEGIERGQVLIDTKSSHIGQVNGLSYVKLGDFAFGFPTRITARKGVVKGQLIDIEREVKLGGPIHSKGVLILTGYITGQFAKNIPLSLSASLVFEQSYGGVEGDSASVAEACALLSAIAEIPLKQSIAITGSMNQHGHVQAIGGVNEKIEGFFDICTVQGLNNEQGVIIPAANIDKLMLRKDVVEAARLGKFHIYAVKNVDEALTILTGIEAGKPNSKGDFPKNSVNGRIQTTLLELAKKTSPRAAKKN